MSRTSIKDRTRVSGRSYVARLSDEPALVNLAGYYDYMSRAYYVSLDYENNNERIRPSCEEMLDAYVPPLFLEKARLAGLAIPEFCMSNGHFDPPAIVDPVNPYTLKGKVVLKPGRAKSIAKSLTRNYTYAICCQQLPPNSRIVHFRSILGWALQPQYRAISQSIWDVFSIPLASVRLIQTDSGDYLLSDISPLFVEDLGARERQYIEERVTWVN